MQANGADRVEVRPGSVVGLEELARPQGEHSAEAAKEWAGTGALGAGGQLAEGRGSGTKEEKSEEGGLLAWTQNESDQIAKEKNKFLGGY